MYCLRSIFLPVGEKYLYRLFQPRVKITPGGGFHTSHNREDLLTTYLSGVEEDSLSFD